MESGGQLLLGEALGLGGFDIILAQNVLSGIILPGEPPLRQATQTHMAPELQRCYIPCSPENSASLALSFL